MSRKAPTPIGSRNGKESLRIPNSFHSRGEVRNGPIAPHNAKIGAGRRRIKSSFTINDIKERYQADRPLMRRSKSACRDIKTIVRAMSFPPTMRNGYPGGRHVRRAPTLGSGGAYAVGDVLFRAPGTATVARLPRA
jgi:hypothetical protein